MLSGTVVTFAERQDSRSTKCIPYLLLLFILFMFFRSLLRYQIIVELFFQKTIHDGLVHQILREKGGKKNPLDLETKFQLQNYNGSNTSPHKREEIESTSSTE